MMQSTKSIRFLLACAPLLLGARTAAAGILDTPPPLLGGQKSSVAFGATGVMNAAGLATMFSCTNPTSSDMDVSVMLFTDAGDALCNDPAAVATTIPSGATRLFSTQNNVQSSFFSTIPLTLSDVFLAIGSAAIISTGKGLICAAWITDVYGSPPMTMMRLPLSAKGKGNRGD